MYNPLNTLKHAWNLFASKEGPVRNRDFNYGYGSSISPTRTVFTRGNERTVVTAVYNRIAIDAAAIDIKHVELDEAGRYKSDVESGINNCLTVEADIDQTSRQFMLDVIS